MKKNWKERRDRKQERTYNVNSPLRVQNFEEASVQPQPTKGWRVVKYFKLNEKSLWSSR